MGRFSNSGRNSLQYPFYHQHLGECTSFKHLGGLQRIGFRRRHQHSCRGSRGAGSAWNHGLVLQVLLLQASIHKYIMVWYTRHQHINTSWSDIAACGMVFSMRRTGIAATGDLDLPKKIWFWLHFPVRRVRKRSRQPWSLFPVADEVKLLESGVFIFSREI